MIKRILCIYILSCGLAIAQAPEKKTSKDKKIDELVQILGSEEQYQAFINVGLDNIIEKYGESLTDSNIKIMREESLNLVQRFLENDLKSIYSKYLTEQEIQDLIDFYSSETGKRFRQMQPLITQEINQVMMSKYMEEFKASVAAKLRQ